MLAFSTSSGLPMDGCVQQLSARLSTSAVSRSPLASAASRRCLTGGSRTRRMQLCVMAPDRRNASASTSAARFLEDLTLVEEVKVPSEQSSRQDTGRQRQQHVKEKHVQPSPQQSATTPRSPPTASKSPQATATASLPAYQWDPSLGWRRQLHHPTRAQLWETIRNEAWNDASVEPQLASFMYSSVLSHPSLEKALAFVLSNKLSTSVLTSVQLLELFTEAYETSPDIADAAVADLLTVRDRDPACSKYSQALLFFKGYQAIQCFRVEHWLWQRGRRTLALALQARVSELFHVDIHPGARIGKGMLIDHATGVVIGETAVVGENVSMLHRVTLGGTGVGNTVRHPTLGNGVLLGAGVSVLGPVVIGAGSKVGAGSVVVSDVPAHSVSVGIPAAVIKRDIQNEPLDANFYDYVI